MAMLKMIFIALLPFVLVVTRVLGVKITKFYVPRGASHEAPLDCTYDLEEDQLYDVKWYKDGLQFYRCKPTGETFEFEVEGVKIQHTKFAALGSCSLTLMMLSSKSAGEYRCEVSTEGPAFKSAVAFKKLRFIESSKRMQNEEKVEEEIKPVVGKASLCSKICKLLFCVPLIFKYIIY